MTKRANAPYGGAQKRARTTLVTGYNRATGGLTAAARGRSLQRAVASAVRKTVEKKGVDFPIGSATAIVETLNTNDSTVCLNLVQAGAGSWNRVGRKIQLQSIRIRGVLQWLLDQQTTTQNYIGNVVRMVVIWDKQPSDGTLPAFDQVFGVTGQDGSETTTYLNPVRYDNMDRFSVLRDCVYNFEPPMYNAGGGTINAVIVRKNFDEFIQLKGRETVFSANTSPMTTAGLSTGGLYVIFRVQSDTTSTNQVFVDLTNSFARLRYIDPSSLKKNNCCKAFLIT